MVARTQKRAVEHFHDFVCKLNIQVHKITMNLNRIGKGIGKGVKWIREFAEGKIRI